jgi:aminoglycoside phosphotransferase (APT) family kinase protein
MQAHDKDRPSAEWIASMRDRFQIEREIDRILTRKLERRAGPGFAPLSLSTLVSGVEALLRHQLDQPFRIEEARWLSGGASKVQMAFTLEWQRPGVGFERTAMVLRMEPAGSIVETSRLREFQLLRAFEGMIPVPPVFWCDVEGEFLPYPAMICGFSAGVARPTTGAGGISGLGTSFGPLSRETLGRQFAQHLAAIHTRGWHDAGLTAFDFPDAGTQSVEWQLNWWERLWEEDVNEDVPLMRLAMAWMRASMPAVDRLSIVHGDYRTGNFLYTEEDNRISAILDWELGHIGDRHEDLAWAIRSTFGHVAEDGSTFLVGGFMPERQFLDLYEESSGLTVDRRRLDYYAVFNTYKNVVIVLATGCRVARGSKSHQDVLLAWLTGIGYPMLEALRRMLEEQLGGEARQ